VPVDPARFRDLAAIVVTHEHVDHMDEDALKTIRANNPKAPLIANASIGSKLSGVTVMESGKQRFGGIEIEAVSAAHADLLNYRSYFAQHNIEFVSLAEPGASVER
jgi:L-ascorbate metabolism protein UlaG (beta-lactamase superfamily)